MPMRYAIFIALLTLFVNVQVSAQVEIKISDENDEPLIGVNVYNEDFSFTGSSDIDGALTIPSLDYATKLTFSYTGYNSIEKTYAELFKLFIRNGRKTPAQLTMLQNVSVLDEVVVVGRRDDAAEDLPWNITTISAKDLNSLNQQTSADILQATGEVFVQKSQMGGGSPVVRGFEANRILLVVDGVRMNNAIYRSGHLQSAITIDPAILERAEVIFGPGSLHYGSDALGGVVHYRSKDPKLSFDKSYLSEGSYALRFSSANLEKTGHVDYSFGNKNWASQTSISVSSYEDMKAGSSYNHKYVDFGKVPFYVDKAKNGEVIQNEDPYIQRGTGYSQIDIMQKLKFQLTKDRYLVFNAQFSNSTDIPRFDRLTQVKGDRDSDLKFAEWYYGPQRRILASGRFVSSKSNLLQDRSQWIVAYQRIDEDRYNRKLDAMWRNFTLVDVNVYSFNFDADKYIGSSKSHQISYGGEVQYNQVASIGGRVHFTNESVLLDQVSRYPSGGSTLLSSGAYLTYHYKHPSKRFDIQAGARYNDIQLTAVFGNDKMDEPVDWPEALKNGVKTQNNALTYAIGTTIRPLKKTSLQLLSSTAFRAPNIDDFGKMRVKNGYVSVPNVNLKPETSLNYEATLTQSFGQFFGKHQTKTQAKKGGFGMQLSATVFYTNINGIIVRQNGTLPNGDSTFVSGDDEYKVQVNVNADNGKVLGYGFKSSFSIGRYIHAAGNLTLTKGRSFNKIGEETPLAHIPPMFGRVSATYHRGPFKIHGICSFNGAKPWNEYAPEGSSDNEDQAIFEVGTPAWQTFDILTEFELSSYFTLQGGIENIADLHYRPFSSGVSAPGRNFKFSLRGKF